MKRLLILLTLVSACSSTESPPTAMSDVGVDSTTNDDTPVDDVMPTIENITVDPSRITEGESALIVVQVSDPQGFDTIRGGSLETPDQQFIGEFEKRDSEFRIEVSWSQLDNLGQIVFFGREKHLKLNARFFDSDGNETAKTTTLILHCGGEPACNGACGNEPCYGPPNHAAQCETTDDCNAPEALCTQIYSNVPKKCRVECIPDSEGACGDDWCLPILPGSRIGVCLSDCSEDESRCTDGLVCRFVDAEGTQGKACIIVAS